MKVLKWTITLLVGLAIILVFAYNFKELTYSVQLKIPFTGYETYKLPLFVFFAVLFVAGYLIGWLQGIIRNFSLKRGLKRKELEIERLKEDLRKQKISSQTIAVEEEDREEGEQDDER